MELEVVYTTDRKSVNRNDRRMDLSTIVVEEASERAVFSQQQKLLMVVLKSRDLKTGSEGIEGYRLKALRQSLHEAVKSTSSEHGKALNVTQSRVRSSIQDAEVGNRPLVVVWIFAQAPLPLYPFDVSG